MDKLNLGVTFAPISAPWRPRNVCELNGQQVRAAKMLGAFDWHHHESEDELFLVVRGRFRMEFRDRQVWVEEGELILVPRGVEHRPVLDEEVCVLLFEPGTTVNTGNVRNERTVLNPESV